MTQKTKPRRPESFPRAKGDLARPFASNADGRPTSLVAYVERGIDGAAVLLEAERIAKERQRRIALLAKAFGIDTRSDGWRDRLITELASPFFPGLTVAFPFDASPGRAVKWTMRRQLCLLGDAAMISLAFPEATQVEVAKHLTKPPPTSPHAHALQRRWGKESPRSLTTRLGEARRHEIWQACVETRGEREAMRIFAEALSVSATTNAGPLFP